MKYPKVYELMRERHMHYNATLAYIERLSESGGAFVIRPGQASPVGRVEKDRRKLEALYDEGYRDAESCYEDMMNYLGLS